MEMDDELGWAGLHHTVGGGIGVGGEAVVRVAAELLDAGASADQEDDYGMTPLHLAAEEVSLAVDCSTKSRHLSKPTADMHRRSRLPSADADAGCGRVRRRRWSCC